MNDFQRAEAARAMRMCASLIDRMWGCKPRETLTLEFKDERDRFTCWLVDACWDGFRYALAGEPRVTLRCLLQVSEYRGRIGGFAPLGMGDTIALLQSIVEDFVPFRVEG